MDFFRQKIEQTLGILHNNPLLWSVECYEPFLKNIQMFNLLKVFLKKVRERKQKATSIEQTQYSKSKNKTITHTCIY